MKQYKLREHLQRLSRKELEDLSERVFGDSNSSLKNKDALVSVLVKKHHRVVTLLGFKESWWERHSNHVYGLIGVVSLVLTLIAFVNTSSNSRPQLSPLDSLHTGEAHDLVFRELKEAYKYSEVVFPKEPFKERILSNVNDLPKATTSGFELIEHIVVTDLRSYRKIKSGEAKENPSPVVQRIRQIIKKDSNSPKFYRLKAYTSGLDVFSDSVTHRENMTAYVSKGLKEKISDKYIVKPRILEFDVQSDSNVDEFLLKVSKTYWNAFQNDDQSWVGVSVGIPTRSITFLVLFPEDKPYIEFDHFVNKHQKRINLPPETYVLEDPDKKWIWWKIENPEPGNGYNIDWEW